MIDQHLLGCVWEDMWMISSVLKAMLNQRFKQWPRIMSQLYRRIACLLQKGLQWNNEIILNKIPRQTRIITVTWCKPLSDTLSTHIDDATETPELTMTCCASLSAQSGSAQDDLLTHGVRICQLASIVRPSSFKKIPESFIWKRNSLRASWRNRI